MTVGSWKYTCIHAVDNCCQLADAHSETGVVNLYHALLPWYEQLIYDYMNSSKTRLGHQHSCRISQIFVIDIISAGSHLRSYLLLYLAPLQSLNLQKSESTVQKLNMKLHLCMVV
jgi:hypothetical protein